MAIKKKEKFVVRTFIRIIDKTKPVIRDVFGNQYVATKWVETNKPINLGSVKKPNKNILGFRIEYIPIKNTEL